MPVVNGTVTSQYPQVVALMADYGSEGIVIFCSGTLIASKWVVTAAHCVRAITDAPSAGGLNDADGFYVVFGTDIYNSEWLDYIKVSRYIQHPDYDDKTLRNDIGLLNLTSAASYTPIGVNETSVAGWGAKNLTYVGFGTTGDGRDEDPIKRFGVVPFEGYDEYFIYGYSGSTNICQGDSGGPCFETAGTRLTLAGVNSFVFSPDGDSTPCVGGGSGATRVDRYLSWMNSNGVDYTLGGTDPGSTETNVNVDVDVEADADGDADGDVDSLWDEPDRPPEGAYQGRLLGGCATVSGHKFGSMALAGLALLGIVRRGRVRAWCVSSPKEV